MNTAHISRMTYIQAMADAIIAAIRAGLPIEAGLRFATEGMKLDECAVGGFGLPEDHPGQELTPACQCPATQLGFQPTDPGIMTFATTFDDGIYASGVSIHSTSLVIED